MILADTSVWADHIARSEPVMVDLLEQSRILMHPYVIAEISLGSLRNRDSMLADLRRLPSAPVATPEETMYLIEREKLFSRGIGYVDTALLASVRLHAGAKLWTRDKRLKRAADDLGLAAIIGH